MRTFALIPAAGKSRRMGQPKLVLPLGATTVLDHVVAALRAAEIADVLVVVAPDGEAVANCASAAGAHVLRLPTDTSDMRSTCLHGLAWLAEHLHPESNDGWLLLPADHPTLGPEVIRTLVSMGRKTSEKTIVIPTHQGRRGHPTWLRWSHVAGIQTMPEGQGLNAYIRSRAAETLEIPWPNDEILLDLDTPEDYVRICGR
jgi:molybdenum cofactor cytidylyltransferase